MTQARRADAKRGFLYDWGKGAPRYTQLRSELSETKKYISEPGKHDSIRFVVRYAWSPSNVELLMLLSGSVLLASISVPISNCSKYQDECRFEILTNDHRHGMDPFWLGM